MRHALPEGYVRCMEVLCGHTVRNIEEVEERLLSILMDSEDTKLLFGCELSCELSLGWGAPTAAKAVWLVIVALLSYAPDTSSISSDTRAVDDIADIPILTIRYRQTIRYRLFLNLSVSIAGTISAGFKFDDITTHDIVISYRHRHIFPLNYLESERALIEQQFI